VTAGNAPTAPASPQPLTPSGLVVHRVPLRPRSYDERSSARGNAVHQRAGDQLTGSRVIDRVLEQGLTDTLGDRTMRPPRSDHRVDQHP